MKKRIWLIIIAVLIALVILLVLSVKKVDLVGSAPNLTNQARDLEAKGDLLEAKLSYQKSINDFPNSGEVANWQRKLDELNIKLLFSSIVIPGSILYDIKPGDNLAKIAKEFKTTAELLMRSNNLSTDKIYPGRKIKVWTKPFSMLVDKSQNILILKSEEEMIKTYMVSTGVNNSSPVGNFKVINKLQNPTWFKAGAVVPADSPENILGSRWLGFDLPGYGIHGTVEPQSLGKQVTQGCVRMSNSDVEELYTIIPVGTEVTIVD